MLPTAAEAVVLEGKEGGKGEEGMEGGEGRWAEVGS